MGSVDVVGVGDGVGEKKSRKMNPMSVVRIGWVLIKLPFGLLGVLAMNMVNIVAPDMMFKLFQRMMKDREEMAIAKKFKSTEDFGFLFSFDRIQMCARGEIRDILKEAQVGCPAPNPPSWPTLASLVLFAPSLLEWQIS